MIESIISTICLLIGYCLGRQMYTKENLERVQKELSKPFADKYVGTVKRPSATQLLRKTNPDLADEEDEMKKALRKLEDE